MKTRSAFCSWSGGKDSALALHRALEAGIQVRYLLTMMTEDGKRSRSNGVSRRVLALQAASLDIPILMHATSWDRYELTYGMALSQLRSVGIDTGIFGDIDIAAHRIWTERICQEAGMHALLPLWQRDRVSVLDDLFRLRFKAVIVAVLDGALAKELLGRTIDKALLAIMQDAGVDLCGENGEYHTVVTAGPDFTFPIILGRTRSMLHGGYWVLDVRP